MSFQNNVFINCPFDIKFKRFLEPLIFTIVYCDFNPLISQTFDSGRNRLDNIIDLIKNSKFSIHDLSRMEATKAGELARFNMPFELGIEIGFRNSGMQDFEHKKCLIIDTKKYRYQAALSDISGNDIEIYSNKPEELVRIVRNWLSCHNRINSKSGPTLIWEDFNEFKVDLQETLLQDGFSKTDINRLPKSQFISLASEWINVRKRNLYS